MVSFTVLSKGTTFLILVILAGVSTATTEETDHITPPALDPVQNTIPGPDYAIINIHIPEQTSWIETGTLLTPDITIRNLGSTDHQKEAIPVTASLGTHPLIPGSNSVYPMKGGEERKITLSFLIPETIPPGEFALNISLDPGRERGDTDLHNNNATAGRLLAIRPGVSKKGSGNCGCS
jgi:hypothetical protein